jgi:hypothetical protein
VVYYCLIVFFLTLCYSNVCTLPVNSIWIHINELLMTGQYDLRYNMCFPHQFVITIVSSYCYPPPCPQLCIRWPQFFVEQNWQGWHMWLSVMTWLGCRLDSTEQVFGCQQVQRHAVVNTIHTHSSVECLPGVKRLEHEPNCSETTILCHCSFCVFHNFERSVMSLQNACQKKNVMPYILESNPHHFLQFQRAKKLDAD